MKRIPRRIFTEEFKRETIKLVIDQGLTLAEASRKLFYFDFDKTSIIQSQ
jgi:transposase-like protein